MRARAAGAAHKEPYIEGLLFRSQIEYNIGINQGGPGTRVITTAGQPRYRKHTTGRPRSEPINL